MCGHRWGLDMTATTAMPLAVRTGFARSCGSNAPQLVRTAWISSTSFKLRSARVSRRRVLHRVQVDHLAPPHSSIIPRPPPRWRGRGSHPPTSEGRPRARRGRRRPAVTRGARRRSARGSATFRRESGLPACCAVPGAKIRRRESIRVGLASVLLPVPAPPLPRARGSRGGAGPTPPFATLVPCGPLRRHAPGAGRVKRVPPTEITTPAGTEAPRSLKCSPGRVRVPEDARRGEARARAAADAAQKRVDEVGAPGGAWHPAQHRRVAHQAAFAAEAMHESRAVYASQARRCERTGAIVSETWGASPGLRASSAGRRAYWRSCSGARRAAHQRGAHAGSGGFRAGAESPGGVWSPSKNARSESRRRSGRSVERGARERAGTFGRRHGGDRPKPAAAARAFAEGLGAEEEEE